MAQQNSSKLEMTKNNNKNVDDMIPEIIGSYSISCDQNLFLIHLDKCKLFTWRFNIVPNSSDSIQISKAFMLDDDLPEFSLSSIFVNNVQDKLPPNSQSWDNKQQSKISNFQIEVAFYSEFYGNFEQKLIIIFENGQNVARKIGVQVCLESALMRTLHYNPEKHAENELSWIKRHKIVPFDGEPEISFESLDYALPPNIEDLVRFGAFDHLDKELTEGNYRERLHLLLHVEEYERRKKIQNLSISVDDVTKYTHEPIPGIHQNLILKLPCDEITTEQAYHLIGKSGKAFIKLTNEFSETCLVFEVLLEQILSNEIVLEMSAEMEKYLDQCKGKTKGVICFRFVDVFRSMHRAIDNIDLQNVFPRHLEQLDRTWSTCKHPDLSKDQSIALNEMLKSYTGTPILVLGPFGSGKTRTMATAILELLKKMESDEQLKYKMLICTHSNSAADHYIEDIIHPFLATSKISTENLLIRVNWELRYTASVSRIVLNYCQVKDGRFVQPTGNEVQKYTIVVSTLVTADSLSRMQLPRDHFSHIFIDEAAQAMEVEAIIPICLKGPKTKVVLAGDHLQLGPHLSSKTAKQLGLGASLLERLFQAYPQDSGYKLKLVENFRSYKEIVELSSALFYEGALISEKMRPPEVDYPLRFYGIHGKEKVSKYHPSYYNTAEVNEVLCIIKKIRKTWPKVLGKFQPALVCVLCCFTAQIQEIRLLLRKNGLSAVRVENVNNVQGLEFDVVILSTVRSYMTLSLQANSDQAELGFLSNPKLLNTAITRAKYLCIFIGEPVALCTFGASKACWKTVLASCHKHGEFHYRLTFDKVMKISNMLKEKLARVIDAADRNQSLNATIEEEQNAGLSHSDSHFAAGLEFASSENSHGNIQSSFSTNSGKTTAENCVKTPSATCRAATVQPNHNTFSMAPFQVLPPLHGISQPRHLSDTQYNVRGMAFRFNQNVRNIPPKHTHDIFTPMQPRSSLTSTQNHNMTTPTCVNNVTMPAQSHNPLPAIYMQGSQQPLRLILQPFQHPNSFVSPSLISNIGSQVPLNTASDTMPAVYLTPDAQNAMAKAVVDFETHKIFVSRYFDHTGSVFPHLSTILKPYLLQMGQINYESQRFLSTMQLYQFPFVIEKLLSYNRQYIDILYRYEHALINALPDPAYDILQPTVNLFVQVRDALHDLKLLLEYQFYQRNRVIVTRSNIRECTEASMGLDRSYSTASLMHSQLVDCIFPALQQCISWKLTHLCSIKLNFLDRMIGRLQQEYFNRQNLIEKAASLQFELSELDSSSSSSEIGYQQDSISSAHDFSLGFATDLQSSPGGSSSSVLSGKQDCPIKKEHIKNSLGVNNRILTSSPRSKASLQAMPSPVASTISSGVGNYVVDDGSLFNSSKNSNGNDVDQVQSTDSSVEQSMKATVEGLVSLTDDETAKDSDSEVEDITNMIRKLRHTDMDVNEWFFDRQNDPFVKEYIASFERHLARRLPSPECETSHTSSNLEILIKKYQMKPKYEPYKDMNISNNSLGLRYFEGTFCFEKNTSTNTVVGVVLLENVHVYFSGLNAVNRSLTGDKVRFEIFDSCGLQRKGRVVSVLERGGWSVLCQASLSDHHLMIPFDDKGPPIIVLNAPSANLDTSRAAVGSAVQSFVVKVIGWPQQMMYPVGIIERDVEERIERKQ